MKRSFIIITLIALLLLTGCWTTRWPYGVSLDRHNFTSTPSMPITVVLRDTITHDELLRLDVPVRKTLVLDLEHKTSSVPTLTNSLPAESVSWEFVDPNDWLAGELDNTMHLAGNDVMLIVEVRDIESSPDSTAVPTYTPTQTQPSQSPIYTPAGPAVRTQTPQPQPAVQQPIPIPIITPQPQPTPALPPQPANEPVYTPQSEQPQPQQPSSLGASDGRPRPQQPAPESQPQPETPAESQPESSPATDEQVDEQEPTDTPDDSPSADELDEEELDEEETDPPADLQDALE